VDATAAAAAAARVDRRGGAIEMELYACETTRRDEAALNYDVAVE